MDSVERIKDSSDAMFCFRFLEVQLGKGSAQQTFLEFDQWDIGVNDIIFFGIDNFLMIYLVLSLMISIMPSNHLLSIIFSLYK